MGEESEKLKTLHPESTDQIAAKQAEISMLWETLKHKVSRVLLIYHMQINTMYMIIHTSRGRKSIIDAQSVHL